MKTLELSVDYSKVASDLAVEIAQLQLDNKILKNLNEQLFDELTKLKGEDSE